MAWTTPRTWVDGETPTAALFNTHIRDNIAVLKTPFGNSGRVAAITAAQFASLDGTALTGLAKLTVDNTYTAGKHNFAAARLVLPVGADLYGGTSGNKTPGSAWIEGDYIHWVATNQDEYRYLGILVGTPGGAVVGSVWVEGDDVHYIDSSGEERRMPFVGSTAVHSDAAAVGGSVWVETYLHFVRESGTLEKIAHQDVVHTDGASHGDTAHTNHQDHDDIGFQDFTDHTDGAHTDFNNHADVPGDNPPPPHTDFANHGDTAHTDHSDHSDTAHTNHSDHDDVPHSNHSDHGDIGHTDGPPENLGPT